EEAHHGQRPLEGEQGEQESQRAEHVGDADHSGDRLREQGAYRERAAGEPTGSPVARPPECDARDAGGVERVNYDVDEMQRPWVMQGGPELPERPPHYVRQRPIRSYAAVVRQPPEVAGEHLPEGHFAVDERIGEQGLLLVEDVVT